MGVKSVVNMGVFDIATSVAARWDGSIELAAKATVTTIVSAEMPVTTVLLSEAQGRTADGRGARIRLPDGAGCGQVWNLAALRDCGALVDVANRVERRRPVRSGLEKYTHNSADLSAADRPATLVLQSVRRPRPSHRHHGFLSECGKEPPIVPRKPPPPHPKGAPRTAGSGRQKGTPNQKTVELRELMAAAAGDLCYQKKFRDAFVRRRLHPSTEIKVWEYAIGRPKEQIEMTANVTMNERLAAEREVLSKLSLPQLEELATASQALVDRAFAMARGKCVKLVAATPQVPAATDVTHFADAGVGVAPTSESPDRHDVTESAIEGRTCDDEVRVAGQPPFDRTDRHD